MGEKTVIEDWEKVGVLNVKTTWPYGQMSPDMRRP
jgi:hypothetical protein